jgi:hypothetical protein
MKGTDDCDWSKLSYKVRVRSTPVYLWGSAGLKKDLTFDKPLLLHVHNDLFGEVVKLGTQVAAGTKKVLGTLQPGESASIPVQTMTGVYATCTLETTVSCLIRESR